MGGISPGHRRVSDDNPLNLFDDIKFWSRRGQRAPHKPLLLLYALGRCARGEPREVEYRTVDEKLAALLRDFGPSRKSVHTEYPFWRLQNDGIWLLSKTDLVTRQGHTDAKKSELLKYNVRGGFPENIYTIFQRNPARIVDVARRLLESNFPETLHDEIAASVGLDLSRLNLSHEKGTPPRDPEFRKRVLSTYEYRCAVCGFAVCIETTPVCLDAAHIRWHSQGGPDEERNGLALCVLHHKLFDLGAFTLKESLIVEVSQNAYGHSGFDQNLLHYHGSTLRPPVNPTHRPDEEFLGWHRKEVFKHPPRPL